VRSTAVTGWLSVTKEATIEALLTAITKGILIAAILIMMAVVTHTATEVAD